MLRRVVPPLALIALIGCGNGHLSVGKGYMGRGQLAVASEYFEYGCKQEDDKDACAALAETHGRLRFRLRQEVDRLKGSEQYLSALARLVALEEVARRSAANGLGADDSADISRENVEVTVQAIKFAESDLDARQSRGALLKNDLSACRQLAALDGSDEGTKERCARLREGFKLYAAILIKRTPYAQGLAQFTRGELARGRLELLEIVDTNHPKYNAVIEIRTGIPTEIDTDWYLQRRDKYHKWVPRRDRKGRLVTRTITVNPSQSQIAAAKKAKRKPPKPKKVKKQVYDLRAGDYRHFERRRIVSMPYLVEVRNLREGRITRSVSGTMKTTAESKYHTYQGHPQARKAVPPPTPLGLRNARPLPSADAMIKNRIGSLAGDVAKQLVKHVE